MSHESPTEASRPVSSSRGITTRGLLVGIVIGLVIGLLISVPLGPRYASPPQQTVYVTEQVTKQVASTTQLTTTGIQFDVIIKYAEKYSNQIGSTQPNVGYTFLVLTLQIQNNVDREFSTSTLYFHVIVNNIKYIVDAATNLLPDALQYVLLQKGGTISGSIVFQVPVGTTSYTPVYEELFVSGQPSINWVHT